MLEQDPGQHPIDDEEQRKGWCEAPAHPSPESAVWDFPHRTLKTPRRLAPDFPRSVKTGKHLKALEVPAI
jgi:hypothetical protein